MDLVALTAVCALALVLGLGVVLAVEVAGRRRLEEELDTVHGELRDLRSRLDRLAGTDGVAGADEATTPRAEDGTAAEYLITSLADEASEPEDPSLVTSGQFASIAVGESLVRVVSLAHGVRRALSPEQRNRIRFEMHREVKRSRRQRRREVKAARRHLRAQQADGREPGLAEDAA